MIEPISLRCHRDKGSINFVVEVGIYISIIFIHLFIYFSQIVGLY